ncbi:DNA ligase [Agarivorans aestuarii]|uniref:DNA ligase n=1 Tax=Agarivorans aestuarii TaxID=1563703 RepID=UPI001C7F0536|nr:DNA ligase [Agarivorans aestuarii]
MDRSISNKLGLCMLLFSSQALHAQSPQPPALVLASDYQQGLDLQNYWVCEKYDGVRAYWDGKQLLSRAGHVIEVPQTISKQLPEMAVDGELWLGRGRFSELVSLIKQQSPNLNKWQEVQFVVFDLPHYPGPYQQRYRHLQTLSSTSEFMRVPVYRAYPGRPTLEQQLAKISAEGGEGLMLRDPQSMYLPTRSNALIKYKSYQDAEAKVVAYSDGKGKYRGMLGALVVQDQQGRQFKIGSGLSDQLRADPPPIGSLVEYRYNGLTEHGKPRFARFVRVHQTL